jgi:fused signal recognition particle receptor
MSKFFKWLKKDTPQEEPAIIDEKAGQADNEATDLVIEKLKNNNSTIKKNSAESIENKDIEQHNKTISAEQTIDIQAQEDSSLIPIENNHSYIKSDTAIENTSFLESQDNQSEQNSSQEEVQLQALAQERIEKVLEVEEQESAKTGFFGKLKRGLSRTKNSIGSGIITLFRGKAIDDELFEELETQLLVADVGMQTTVKIIKKLTESSNHKQLKDGDALYQLLKEQMTEILNQADAPFTLESSSGPFVILMVGVNGVGKTTTIGKMAKQFQQQGKTVMLAAGDTFRAAAVEQLQVWGERNNIPVVAQQTGSDSASVIYDAFQSAQAKNIDVLIADTAGRLQNKEHLMEELKKVVRVIKKINPQAPHEIMLTLDAGTGQNAVSQTKLFHQAVGITGISLTKLDGTAKGGVIFAIADQFDIPIRYIGIGEGIDDLRPFDSQDFVNALFVDDENQQEKTN